MTDRTALVVDDASANRDFLERLLTGAQFKILGAGTGAAALKAIAELDSLSLALVDWKLPDTDGLELAVQLRDRFPELYIVMATMYDERTRMEEAFSKGCNVFLVKPYGFMELFQKLMTTTIEELRGGPKLVIDQYGPRVYKLATQTAEFPKVKKDD
jgi:CheY-like chemotaxis protein